MIRLKTKKDVADLRESGAILFEILNLISKKAALGVPLLMLDEYARDLFRMYRVKPAFLGYRPEGSDKPYSASICVSVNDKIVHGVPNDYVLKNGDILSIDAGVEKNGYITDSAVTVGIGRISKNAERLLTTTKKALFHAIEECVPGKHIGDLGYVIEKTAKRGKCAVIRALTGHGVGFELHEDPTVLNFGNRGSGMKLVPGLVIAIEPMFSLGSGDIIQAGDGSYKTSDGSLSAHFEHTVHIAENGAEILTS